MDPTTKLKDELIEKLTKIEVPIIEFEKLIINKNNNLGEGRFGITYSCKYDDKEVAVKKIAEDKIFKGINDLIRELNPHNLLQDPRVPHLYGVSFQGKYIYLLTGLIPKHMTLLEKCKEVEYKQQIDFFIQTISIIIELHKKKIVHNSLKPKAILVTEDNKAHLINFGKFNTISYSANAQIGGSDNTKFYLPPEACCEDDDDEDDLDNKDQEQDIVKILDLSKLKITKEYDIWALGCTIHHILTNELPWTNFDYNTIKGKDEYKKIKPMPKEKINEVQLTRFLNYKLPFPIDKNIVKPEMVEILNRIFVVEPEKRINIEELHVELLNYYQTL